MKTRLIILTAGIVGLIMGGCQSAPHGQQNFSQDTHRTYNPETGTFEQSPPFGKQSNKADVGQQ